MFQYLFCKEQHFCTPQGVAFTKAAGKLLGATAGAFQFQYPEVAEVWANAADENEDLIFSPPQMQYSSSYPEQSCVYTNQFIFCCIGPDSTPFVDKAEDHSLIAFHVDESDESIINSTPSLSFNG